MFVNGLIVERVDDGDRRRSTLPLDVPGDRFELLTGPNGEENVRPFVRERSANASINSSASMLLLRQRCS
jgi:hypothetical protein